MRVVDRYLLVFLIVISMQCYGNVITIEDTSYCSQALAKVFDQYDFVTNPLPKGMMFHTEILTSTNHSLSEETDVSDSTSSVRSTYYLTDDRMALISREIEVYSSMNCVIQIFKEDKIIYVYDANGDSIRKNQINALLDIKKRSFDLIKSSTCAKLGDTLIRYTLTPFSIDQDRIILEVDQKTNYLRSYLVYFKNRANGLQMTRTDYLVSATEKINKMMKGDFLNIVYGRGGKIQPCYIDYQVEDLRLNK